MPKTTPLYIAVDLGAGSGRVFLVGLGEGELLLDEVRRFQYPPVRRHGHLRWDLERIGREVVAGLDDACRRAEALGRPIASLGVDSWGVDYGLVDATGAPVEDPVCYRDERTEGVMPRAFERMPRHELFARTGIQLLPFNTVFQLLAHRTEGIPSNAASLLLIPDLVASRLTGRFVTERTNASTTQMLSVATGEWDDEIAARLDLPRGLLTRIVDPGATIGPVRADRAGARAAGLSVVAVATHDTGSAVAGAPIDPSTAYISSGTWSLVGIELDQPLVTDRVERGNFTNERGAAGTIRFLKNVMGLWLLEACRAAWARDGEALELRALLDGLDEAPGAGVIFPDDPRLLNPPSMPAAIERQLIETGQRVPGDARGMVRVILDSLALRYASVLRRIEQVTGRPLSTVRIVGGGSRNAYLNQATASASGRPVEAGPVECTVIGNAVVQAMAAGRFGSLAEARGHVSAALRPERIEPRTDPRLDELSDRYSAIEARFLGDDG
jgi:rhamnulokinase